MKHQSEVQLTEDASYDAFLTYSHRDARSARRVQGFLEGYRLPGEEDGAEPRRLRVFLDRTDLRSGLLPDEITSALATSRCLVVCCSPAARGSTWVAREIEAFRSGGDDRPVAGVLLRGEPEEAVPEALEELEVRVSDVRGGWRLGWLRPRAHVELVRVVARIAGLDLRALIPWDRRRRRRRLAARSGAGALALAAVLAFPVAGWDPLPVPTGPPEGMDARERIEGAEVVDGELVVAGRFRGAGPQGERDYVNLWRGVESGELRSDWLESNYAPSRRLLPVPVADRELVARAADAMPGALSGDAWIGEPRPGDFVVVRPLPIPEDALPQDDTDPPPVGSSEVFVHAGGRTSRSVVEGLHPPEPEVRSPRSFAPSAGLPVAWGGGALWLGTPAGGPWLAPGGLWRRPDGAGEWIREPGFSSVASIFVDEGAGSVVVATRGASIRSGIVTLSVPSEMRVRALDAAPESRGGPDSEAADPAAAPDAAGWRPFEGPDHGSASDIEIAGRLADSRLVVRVDESLWVKSRKPLVARIAGW